MKHFSYSQLDMFKHGEMPFWQRLLCKAHLRRCPQCRALMAQLEEDAELIRRIREAADRRDPGVGAV